MTRAKDENPEAPAPEALVTPLDKEIVNTSDPSLFDANSMVVAEGGTLTCSVRVNKAWTAETDCDWLTITTVRCGDADPSTVTGANNGASLSNGVATVKATGLPYITTKVEVGRNSGGESRTGHIIIKSEGAEIEKVAVTQASGAQITIEGLTDNTLELSDNPTESGAEVKFTVNAPYPWTIAPSGAAAWYEVSPGQGAANTDVEVTVKALEQNLSFRRFGEFTITAAEGDATLTEKIALSQQPVSPGTVKWNLASPVQWSFSEEDMGNYAQDFKGGPDSPYNTVLAQSGPGYLSYTHTAPSDPDKKCERIVGSTGHPYITGGWPGDYWTFAVPVTNLDAGTKVRFTAITRTSATGHKFWRMEYNDGGTWKTRRGITNDHGNGGRGLLHPRHESRRDDLHHGRRDGHLCQCDLRRQHRIPVRLRSQLAGQRQGRTHQAQRRNDTLGRSRNSRQPENTDRTLNRP